jgi:hypothetical protein
MGGIDARGAGFAVRMTVGRFLREVASVALLSTMAVWGLATSPEVHPVVVLLVVVVTVVLGARRSCGSADATSAWMSMSCRTGSSAAGEPGRE